MDTRRKGGGQGKSTATWHGERGLGHDLLNNSASLGGGGGLTPPTPPPAPHPLLSNWAKFFSGSSVNQ